MSEAAKRTSSLKPRIVSAVLFIPTLVLLITLGGWFFLAMVEAMAILGLLEFYRMARARGAAPHGFLGTACGAGMVALLYGGHTAACGVLITVTFLLILVLELRRGRTEGSMFNLGATALGVFYVAWLGSHLAMLRRLPPGAASNGAMDPGGALVLFTFLVTWSGDSGAYFVGRTWGRRPLFAAVSPKKSVEGAMGGLAFAVGVGAVCGTWLVQDTVGLVHGVILGVVAGVVGPIGDLVESLLKRDSGLKDSASFIPGHGGVLDRFDSLLFVAPVFYYYLKYMVFHG